MEGRWGLWIVGSVDNLPFFIFASFPTFPCLIVIYSRFYSVLYGGVMRGFVSVRGVMDGRV